MGYSVHTPLRRALVLGVVATLAGAASASGASVAAPPPQLSAALSAWTKSNPATGALVWRLDPGGPVQVLAYKPEQPRRPASTMKIVTAASALIALGPHFRFETRLYAGENARLNGDTLIGPLYLKGYGDPTLATPRYARKYLRGLGGNLPTLARSVRVSGIRRVSGPLVVDETFFDGVRRGLTWPARYATECQPLSGMTVNQSWLGDERRRYVKSPPRAAGNQLRFAMRRVGVANAGPVISGRAPVRGRLLSTVKSPPLRVIARLTLPDSDNFIAEMLLKDVGAYTRGTGSSAVGAAAARSILEAQGVMAPADRIVDGSGLALENRLTPATLVRLMAAASADRTWGSTLIASLPRGGEGTLRRRFREAGLRSRVRAKTGYISRTSTLAGVVGSPTGTRYAFAFLMNSGTIAGARATQDRLVKLLGSGVADFAAAG